MVRLIVIISTILLSSLVGLSQDNQDFGMWFGADAKKELNENWNLNGGLAIRTNDNSSHVRQLFYQVGITSKGYVKGLKTTVSYRNRFINSYAKNVVNHRLIWDLSYKLKFSPLSIQFRNRIQSTSSFKGAKVYDRFRIKAKISLENNVKAFVSTEFFNHLNNTRGETYQGQRWAIGMEYKINEKTSFAIAYIRHNDATGYAPLKMNIIDLGIGFDL